MRCARVELLVDRYVDGALDSALAREVEAHALGCARCATRIAAARKLVEDLAAQPAVRAPRGFADRVMAAVYREALAGRQGSAAAAAHAADAEEGRPLRIPARVYRRLGLSFLLTAGVLAVSLLIPRGAYPTLIGTGNAAAAFAGESAGLVKSTLTRADDAVQEILREQPNGGTNR